MIRAMQDSVSSYETTKFLRCASTVRSLGRDVCIDWLNEPSEVSIPHTNLQSCFGESEASVEAAATAFYLLWLGEQHNVLSLNPDEPLLKIKPRQIGEDVELDMRFPNGSRRTWSEASRNVFKAWDQTVKEMVPTAKRLSLSSINPESLSKCLRESKPTRPPRVFKVLLGLFNNLSFPVTFQDRYGGSLHIKKSVLDQLEPTSAVVPTAVVPSAATSQTIGALNMQSGSSSDSQSFLADLSAQNAQLRDILRGDFHSNWGARDRVVININITIVNNAQYHIHAQNSQNPNTQANVNAQNAQTVDVQDSLHFRESTNSMTVGANLVGTQNNRESSSSAAHRGMPIPSSLRAPKRRKR